MDKTDLASILRRVVLQLGKQPETLLSRKKKKSQIVVSVMKVINKEQRQNMMGEATLHRKDRGRTSEEVTADKQYIYYKI